MNFIDMPKEEMMIDSKIIFCDRLIIKKSLDPASKMTIEQVKISIDSRSIKINDLFVALSGLRFNGFDFVPEVLDKGALGVVFSKKQDNGNKILMLKKKYPDRYFIEVEDTYRYLKLVAMEHVQQWKKWGGTIIGITGSNGKTTTKEMLAFILQALIDEEVFYTQGNFNNQVGVPLTIFELLPRHKWAIIEMGTSQKGEIRALCETALPDMGIITNIAAAHLEYLKNKDGVFQEKRALYDFVMENLREEGVFVLNGDDEYLKTLPANKNVITFGKEFGKYRIKLHWDEVEITDKSWILKLKNKFITGDHNLTNLVCSFLMAKQLFPLRINELVAAANSFRPTSNRSTWVSDGPTDIFLDAYNANPSSMKAAITGFLSVVTQRDINPKDVLWIIGDMNELGEQANTFHQELGKMLRGANAAYVVFIGQYYGYFELGFGKKAQHLSNTCDFKRILGEKYLNSFKMVFIKGSRSLQLESLVDIK